MSNDGETPRDDMSERETDTPTPTDEQRVDYDKYWNIEEIDADSEIYTFFGGGGPPGSEAVAKAKKQFTLDYDVEFREVVGRTIAKNHGRRGGCIVVVVHRPELAANEVM